MKELQQQADPNIVIALAGNKLDLADQRKVDVHVVQQYTEQNSLLFLETSAKSAENVGDLFLAIGRKINI